MPQEKKSNGKLNDGFVKIKASKAPEGKPQHMEIGKEYIVTEETADLLVKKKVAEKVK